MLHDKRLAHIAKFNFTVGCRMFFGDYADSAVGIIIYFVESSTLIDRNGNKLD